MNTYLLRAAYDCLVKEENLFSFLEFSCLPNESAIEIYLDVLIDNEIAHLEQENNNLQYYYISLRQRLNNNGVLPEHV